MTPKLRKTPVLIAGLMTASLTLSACDGAYVGVGYNDPYYDSLLWNDYYHDRDVDIDIDVDRPDRPGRPNPPPQRPKPPIAKPPVKPPVARPLPARPPIHRPSGGGRLR